MPSRSLIFISDSDIAAFITVDIARMCCLEATSGTIPPNVACKLACEATILEMIFVPESTTAAAVSSQDVSIPSIIFLSIYVNL